jgi:uncharacterized membrane protein
MDTPGATPLPTPPPPAAASGLSDNVAGALAYITIIPAIVFLVLEPYSRNSFIRFHSFQCLALAACWICVSIIMAIPVLGWILGVVGLLVLFCAWILCIVKAFAGVRFKLPVIGNIVDNLANQR